MIDSMPFMLKMHIEVTPDYIAFSYYWGRPHASRPLLKTERGTLSSRITGINPNEVPKTIADAFW
jgi:hypothetical protein